MAGDEGDQVFEAAAELFGLLSTPTRLRIVHLLKDGEMSVGQLSAGIGATSSNLSQHLGTMYRCGLLARRRDGAHVLYRIAPSRIGLLADWLNAERAATAAPTPPAVAR